MQVNFYDDVPKALIDIVRKIKYNVISPAQGLAFLQQLEAMAATYNIPGRTRASSYATHDVPDNVPMEAINAINGRDWSGVSKMAIMGAKPFITQKLKSMGLL